MPGIVFEDDLYKYINEEDLANQCKYGGSIYINKGRGMDELSQYQVLDEDDVYGGSFLSVLGDAAKFIGNNAGTIGNVVGALGKVADLSMNIAEGVEKINTIKALRQKALEADAHKVAEALANQKASNRLETTDAVALPVSPVSPTAAETTTETATEKEPKKSWTSMFKFGKGVNSDYLLGDLPSLPSTLNVDLVNKIVHGSGFQILE